MREFSDVSVSLRDQLFKLYKKRTTQIVNKQQHQKRELIQKTFNQTQLNAVHFMNELGELNPYSDRPSTAQQLNAHETELNSMLDEMDKLENLQPQLSNVDQFVWERFVQFRRQKVAFEAELRQKSLQLSEMSFYLQKRIEEDEKTRRKIDEISKESLA
jgi:hypothetical protein